MRALSDGDGGTIARRWRDTKQRRSPGNWIGSARARGPGKRGDIRFVANIDQQPGPVSPTAEQRIRDLQFGGPGISLAKEGRFNTERGLQVENHGRTVSVALRRKAVFTDVESDLGRLRKGMLSSVGIED